MATIEELDNRTKEIENNLKIISEGILKQIRTIMKVEERLGERFKELSDLKVKVMDIEKLLREHDMRIRHFETVYKKRV